MALLGVTLLASLAWAASEQTALPPNEDAPFSIEAATVVGQPKTRAFEIRGGLLQPDRSKGGQYSIVSRNPMSKASGNTCDPSGDVIFRDGFE